MSLKVILHYDAGPELAELLLAQGAKGLSIAAIPESDERAFMGAIRDANVLWHALKPVTAEVMDAAPGLRLIQKLGVGLDAIDLEAARARKIAVCNMPGTNTRAVAEMTLLLMLATLRRLTAFDQSIRGGGPWVCEASTQDTLGEIAGRTVGLVGYGGVPQALAPILEAMGAEVLYSACRRAADTVASHRDLDELLAESDIVSLHLPLAPETRGMIDAAALARMKPGAILINTARGALIDEKALAEAIRSGHLRGAGLDVFADEPIAADHPLLKLDNVVVTPHVAWLTAETLARSISVAAENCRRLETGEALLHRVV